MMKPKRDFSFGDVAVMFEDHIGRSIPGYREVLLPECMRQSVRFVQPRTNVYDIGCSTGRLLRRVQRANQAARPDVNYIGIDRETMFEPQWQKCRAKNVQFKLCDAITHDYENASLVFSLFLIQFVRSTDKQELLNRICRSLVEGGALIIAEKTFAETARLQEVMGATYYDFKREMGFTPAQILDKERGLRGLMTSWDEAELRNALVLAGFEEISSFWRSSLFVGYIALKTSMRTRS
jgi:tRNA (cmo5U34)-methyltransferase